MFLGLGAACSPWRLLYLRTVMKRWFLKLHRWSGFFLLFPLLFYCLTGVLLNHRRDFGYFLHKYRTLKSVAPHDDSSIKEFIDFYRQQIGRSDSPRVIRIRGDGLIEFLYGTHGKVTYVIDPLRGKMEIIEKSPWPVISRLNDLHRASGFSFWWVFLADALALMMAILALTGLFLLPLRRADWFLLLMGGLVLLLSLFFL